VGGCVRPSARQWVGAWVRACGLRLASGCVGGCDLRLASGACVRQVGACMSGCGLGAGCARPWPAAGWSKPGRSPIAPQRRDPGHAFSTAAARSSATATSARCLSAAAAGCAARCRRTVGSRKELLRRALLNGWAQLEVDWSKLELGPPGTRQNRGPRVLSATEPPQSSRMSQTRVVPAPPWCGVNNLALTLVKQPQSALIGQTQATHCTHPVWA
jgi:hypothetical protein